jgi:large subunit ribosomal protein L13
MNKTTYMMKKDEIKRDWYIVDASEAPLGRVSSKIAMCLMGKNKPEYTPHMDMGGFVIVVNAANTQLTGKKLDNKIYYKHTGYPGGIKDMTARDMLEKKPEDVIIKSVKGMLPKNKLAARMLTRLKVYKGSDHKHEAQQPKKI